MVTTSHPLKTAWSLFLVEFWMILRKPQGRGRFLLIYFHGVSTFYVVVLNSLFANNALLVDWLPAWFPGTAYKMKAAEQRRRFTDFRELPYKYTLDHMVR
jgi:hypothetical protein